VDKYPLHIEQKRQLSFDLESFLLKIIGTSGPVTIMVPVDGASLGLNFSRVTVKLFLSLVALTLVFAIVIGQYLTFGPELVV
jgi:hypothetical protein